MLLMVVNDHQIDWDTHLPRVLFFTYHTAIYDYIGFSPFYITISCSPILPIDAMLGILFKQQTKKSPVFVGDLHLLLTSAYHTVRSHIQSAHASVI